MELRIGNGPGHPSFGPAGSQGTAAFTARDLSFQRLLEQAESLRGRDSASGGKGEDEGAALREAARDFEALFIHHIIKGMRRTVPEGGLFEKSFAREVYEDMMDQETAKSMATAGGIGLSDLLYDQLSGRR